MFDFHEKRKIRSWLFSKPVIGFLFLVSGVLAVSVYERYQKERETAEKRAQHTEELAHLRAHVALLEQEVGYLQSPRGIEEEIRDRFDVAKAGEQAVIVVAQPPATTSRAVEPFETDADTGSEGFFSRFFFWR